MDFNDLKEIHQYLETIPQMKKDFDLPMALKRFADKTTEQDIKDKAKWEIFVFDFDIRDGEIIPLHSTTKEDGTTIFQYPSYDDFTRLKPNIRLLNTKN